MYAAEKPALLDTYLEHIASTGKHDLIFFEKRSTPKVVSKGQPFRAPESYGKQTKRRPATEEEEKTIARGDWVRVDQSGKKGGEDGYKKTRMKGREHLVQSGMNAYLEHFGVRGMKWGVRKQSSSRKETAKRVAKTAAVVAGVAAVAFVMTRHGRRTLGNVFPNVAGKPKPMSAGFNRFVSEGRKNLSKTVPSRATMQTRIGDIRQAGVRAPVTRVSETIGRQSSATAAQARASVARYKDVTQTEWRTRVNNLSKDIAEANRAQAAWMRSMGLNSSGRG